MSAEVLSPPTEKEKQKEKTVAIDLPQYHVVLLDDDDHSYQYVIEMLGAIFGHGRAKAFRMACEVDASGRVVVDTTTKERAELKQKQIHDYGPDWRIPHCQGSMSAVVEPAD